MPIKGGFNHEEKAIFGILAAEVGSASRRGFFVPTVLGAQNGAVVAHDAWARVPAPSKMETAVYMVIENHSAQPRAVVSVSSNAADKVEMHQMKMMAAEKKEEKASSMPGMAKKEESGMPGMPKKRR